MNAWEFFEKVRKIIVEIFVRFKNFSDFFQNGFVQFYRLLRINLCAQIF
jgi:hypothetical protein